MRSDAYLVSLLDHGLVYTFFLLLSRFPLLLPAVLNLRALPWTLSATLGDTPTTLLPGLRGFLLSSLPSLLHLSAKFGVATSASSRRLETGGTPESSNSSSLSSVTLIHRSIDTPIAVTQFPLPSTDGACLLSLLGLLSFAEHRIKAQQPRRWRSSDPHFTSRYPTFTSTNKMSAEKQTIFFTGATGKAHHRSYNPAMLISCSCRLHRWHRSLKIAQASESGRVRDRCARSQRGQGSDPRVQVQRQGGRRKPPGPRQDP